MKARICSICIISLAMGMMALLSTGCSTRDGRIKKNQTAFDALPAEEQANIRAGKVGIGYTPEMVTMALGKPDRVYNRTTANGAVEVWAYRSKAPAFSFGVGVGGGGGSTAVGTGVGVTTGGDQSDDKVRVVFEGGKVSAIESRAK
ncbi:hypothetical protein OH491_09125 [Termitidicoccus mucosus]|uniref:Lipoprotein SmpA/OmlA domain-containing protein n=2 Tax=Termitidicoccus mucosus TaxID=1184151 RepID=A0A178IFY4_9BACT|nr:hypothetical protein AW736_19950 [Opitutaceae bacterium TSB47]